MTDEERNKILKFIDEVESQFPYKVYGNYDTYCKYNEGWCDSLDRIRSFIENYK